MGLGKHRSESMEEVEIDLVPIMNTFLVLVPFLLLSAAFYHLKAIDTSTPVLAERKKEASLDKNRGNITITPVMEIRKDGIYLSAISDSLGTESLGEWEMRLTKEKKGNYPLPQVFTYLQKIKEKYPASDTLIIIPEGCIIYDTIIQAMDVARYFDDKPFFPRMVLSGKLSQEAGKTDT